MNGQADSERLRRTLSPHLAPNQPGACSVLIHYDNGEAVVDVPLPEQWRVRISEPLIQSLHDWLTEANVVVLYDAAAAIPPQPARSYGNYGGGGYQSFQGAEY